MAILWEVGDKRPGMARVTLRVAADLWGVYVCGWDQPNEEVQVLLDSLK